MRFIPVRVWTLSIVAITVVETAPAYQSAYRPTPAGVFEVKVLPTCRAYSATEAGSYSERENLLFMRLFRFLRANRLRMTVPVEVETQTAAMRFFVDSGAPDRLEPHGEVRVEMLGERRVASAGARGSYTEDNVRKTTEALRRWLAGQAEWIEDGPPRVAYWNSPFLPGFLKRHEVHIPVRPTAMSGS